MADDIKITQESTEEVPTATDGTGHISANKGLGRLKRWACLNAWAHNDTEKKKNPNQNPNNSNNPPWSSWRMEGAGSSFWKVESHITFLCEWYPVVQRAGWWVRKRALPFPAPGDLPDPGIEPSSLAPPVPAGRFFTASATWEAPVKKEGRTGRLSFSKPLTNDDQDDDSWGTPI